MLMVEGSIRTSGMTPEDLVECAAVSGTRTVMGPLRAVGWDLTCLSRASHGCSMRLGSGNTKARSAALVFFLPGPTRGWSLFEFSSA